MNKLQYKRLETLLETAKNIDPDQFNMNNWWTNKIYHECGCLIGHSIKQGKIKSFTIDSSGDLLYKNTDYLDREFEAEYKDLAYYYGITLNESLNLFDLNYKESYGELGIKEAITKIKRLLKKYKES